ncbi:MAG: aspartate/glutamate racemase family protein, partial [Alphaproteobacteria bacterium]|nr:aspartate/glutamate racemase family protein [Alphaproteobacteria bacterium]
QNAVAFFDRIGTEFLAIPCNTAHKRLLEFCGSSLPKVVNIITSTLDNAQTAEGIILIGTNRTTGVNLQPGEIGTYEGMRREKYSDKISPFVTPSSEQQTTLMEAIYDVKAGRFTEAKDKIFGIVTSLKSGDRTNYPVILGCTEFALAISEADMIQLRVIDPSKHMAVEASRKVAELNVTRNNAATNSNGLNPSGIFTFTAAHMLSNPTRKKRSNEEMKTTDRPVIDFPAQITLSKNGTYRIRINDDQASTPARIIERKTFLESVWEEIHEDVTTSNAKDRIRSNGEYISIHSPDETLQTNLAKWAAKKEITIESAQHEQER